MSDRFWSKVEKTDTCWFWQGAVTPNGYGMFHKDDTEGSIYAHRFALEERLRHPLADGEWALHHCDIRRCVRNDGEVGHVYAGSAKQNTADMMERGRGRWQQA